MKTFTCIAVVASMLFGLDARGSQQSYELICETAIGMVVPTADTARETYEAVLHGRGDRRDLRADVLMNDGGDFWTVFQSYEGRGGKLLELEIKKCDGTVRGRYSR